MEPGVGDRIFDGENIESVEVQENVILFGFIYGLFVAGLMWFIISFCRFMSEAFEQSPPTSPVERISPFENIARNVTPLRPAEGGTPPRPPRPDNSPEHRRPRTPVKSRTPRRL